MLMIRSHSTPNYHYLRSQPSAKKKKTIEDYRYRDACEVMEAVKPKISTTSLAFGEHVNQKLLTYSQYVRNQVEYKISSILYEADM